MGNHYSSAVRPSRYPTSGEDPHRGRLWQVPVFLLGLLAVTLLFAFRAGSERSPSARAERHLRAAEQALETGNHRQAAILAQQLLEDPRLPPHLLGEVHFVLGRATLSAAEEALLDEQAACYRRAQASLQQAEQRGVSGPNRVRLAYALARVHYHTGGALDQVIPALEKALELSPADRVEGYALLVQLYLQKTPPDPEAALRTSEKLLAQPGLTNLSQARLRHSEILLRSKRTLEARQVLDRISPNTPQYAAAQHLRALSLYHDQDWRRAAEIWEKLTAGSSDWSELVHALYLLGDCHQRLNARAEARKIWERLLREFPGEDEALAANFRLAEVLREDNQGAEAQGYYIRGLQAFRVEVPNRCLDSAQVRRMVESGMSAWLDEGQHDRVWQLAEVYRRLAAPGQADLFIARASQARGLQILAAHDRAAGAEAAKQQEEAEQLLRTAGEAFLAAAGQRKNEPDHPDLLWASSESFLQGRQYARTAVVLKQYLGLPLADAQRQRALLVLGEAYFQLQDMETAIQLLTEVVSHSGPHHCRAQYLLARAQIEVSRFQEAEENLRSLLAYPFQGTEPPEVQQAQFELGRIHYLRRQFPEAINQFRRTLEQVRQDPQVYTARYLLADSCRQVALEENKRIPEASTDSARRLYEKLKRDWLRQAWEQFHGLASELTDRRLTHKTLGAAEEDWLRRSRLAIARCHFDLGEQEAAIESYQVFVNSYYNHPECMLAYQELILCYLHQREELNARRTAEKARHALIQFDDHALQAATRMSRAEWQHWFDSWGEKGEPQDPRGAAAAAPGQMLPPPPPPPTPPGETYQFSRMP
jgi:tetratricopeptide (TPR) repeat protein